MTAPIPYLQFPGTAREALTFYQEIFGGNLSLYSNADMGRTEGDGEAIGHGVLEGPVSLYGADADPGTESYSSTGLMFALLGAAKSEVLRGWFSELSADGTVVDDLQVRPWGASDGQVIDRFGLLWLIGYEHED